MLDSDENTEGHDAVFCEGDYQGWIHRICATLTHPAFENLSESTPYLCSYCTFTKQYKEIFFELKETVKKLTSKITELEGAQEPSLIPQNETLPSVATKCQALNILSSHQSVLPERKLNVVVYCLEENPSNTIRQDRLQLDVKSVISAFSELENPMNENSIKDCYRLGKYNTQASHPRPVLVKFLRYCT